jgi:hypothetical protein
MNHCSYTNEVWYGERLWTYLHVPLFSFDGAFECGNDGILFLSWMQNLQQ